MFVFFKKILKKYYYSSLLLKKQNIIIKNIFEISYQHKKKISLKINEYENQAFSQFGEDGIIRYITDNINISRKFFVEIGVENYEEANTRLLLEYNWTGLVIESNKDYCQHIVQQEYYYKNSLICLNEFVREDNINKILIEKNILGKIGLLSIDIDGNDFWIWKKIDVIDPDIVVIEYNSRFAENSVTIPYDSDFIRGKKFHKVYYGASLNALYKLGLSKGYSLVGTNSNGNNAFFVKKELLNSKIKSVLPQECFNFKSFKESEDDQNIDLMKYPTIVI
jgi:hypothetical protein